MASSGLEPAADISIRTVHSIADFNFCNCCVNTNMKIENSLTPPSNLLQSLSFKHSSPYPLTTPPHSSLPSSLLSRCLASPPSLLSQVKFLIESWAYTLRYVLIAWALIFLIIYLVYRFYTVYFWKATISLNKLLEYIWCGHKVSVWGFVDTWVKILHTKDRSPLPKCANNSTNTSALKQCILLLHSHHHKILIRL